MVNMVMERVSNGGKVSYSVNKKKIKMAVRLYFNILRLRLWSKTITFKKFCQHPPRVKGVLKYMAEAILFRRMKSEWSNTYNWNNWWDNTFVWNNWWSNTFVWNNRITGWNNVPTWRNTKSGAWTVDTITSNKTYSMPAHDGDVKLIVFGGGGGGTGLHGGGGGGHGGYVIIRTDYPNVQWGGSGIIVVNYNKITWNNTYVWNNRITSWNNIPTWSNTPIWTNKKDWTNIQIWNNVLVNSRAGMSGIISG